MCGSRVAIRRASRRASRSPKARLTVRRYCAAEAHRIANKFIVEGEPYRSLVHPMWKKHYGEYDHLARVKEWAASGGESEELSSSHDPRPQNSGCRSAAPESRAADPERLGVRLRQCRIRQDACAGATGDQSAVAGEDPGKILCITFTKAAAANMATRVFDTLAEWTTLDDAALDERIRPPPAKRRMRPSARLRGGCLPTPWRRRAD